MRSLAIGLVCAIAIGALASQACQVQGSCETTPANVDYCFAGDAACQGHIIVTNDGTYWESGPQFGNFLSFGAQQTFHMHFRDAVTGKVLTGLVNEAPFIQVSSTQLGDVPGNSFIEGADGLVNINIDQDQQSIWIQNGSCGSYWFRVVVKVSTPVSDGGTE